jgi:hypothetical protein
MEYAVSGQLTAVSAIAVELVPLVEWVLVHELKDAPPILKSADLAKVLGTTAGNVRQIRRRNPRQLPPELERDESAIASWSKTAVAVWIARRSMQSLQEPVRRGRRSTAQNALQGAKQ